ncbi:hypothetical protein L1987_12263 [Smallanthus sonchifolius]|uniref:Uncharacterized protein n=1 Tax=Smallanthus sonchifolius TaxID=185202 RepID=A0ACB9JFF9_9ASTR|nr:hypothetical protein L1987_12263 [Smallanthus sonchifolius]
MSVNCDRMLLSKERERFVGRFEIRPDKKHLFLSHDSLQHYRNGRGISSLNPLLSAYFTVERASDYDNVLTNMDDGEVKRSKRLTGNSSNTLRTPSNLEGSHVQHSLKNRRTGDQSDHAPPVKPERPLGNRVAVRKYREKKKAQNAYL